LVLDDVNPADLWFGRDGSNLTIALVGAQDTVTVANWFAGDCKLDSIRAGPMALAESRLAQLLEAMSSVGAPAGAGYTWTGTQEDALAPVLAACWEPVD
jgi:hypothetical protein